jgi:uncharacterized protein YdeI (BOF family)
MAQKAPVVDRPADVRAVHGDMMVRPNWEPHVPLFGAIGIVKSTDGSTYTFKYNGGEVQIAVDAQVARGFHRILGKLLESDGGVEAEVEPG